MSRFSISVFQCFSVFGALAVLWFRLIDHLRVEWTVNPQYGYGWAVPFLCLWMLWRRGKRHELELRQPRMDTDEHGCRRIKPRNTPNTRNEDTNSTKGHEFEGWRRMGWVRGLGFWAAALLYLPTRLIQEANPEWRLVSWALAIEVITLTFYLLRSISFEVPGSRFQVPSSKSKGGSPESTVQSPRPTVHSTWPLLHRGGCGGGGIRGASLAFPLLFFLVAVPWPTVIEQPIVQGLTGANTALTVEAVGLLGAPALQHGNRMEVATGMVGIDEGCSGMRSLQVTLMLSLLFGEVYRLGAVKRVWLCLSGFGLAFAFNVGRTTALTWIAANKGTAAMANWHDPLGVGVLIGCFACVWLMARTFKSKVQCPESAAGGRWRVASGRWAVGGGWWWVVLLGWVVLCEAGTEGWYRAHEAKLSAPVTWTVKPPQENPSLRHLPLSEKTRRLLRYDEALNACWDEGELHFQAIFLRWNPGRTAVHLAKTHTPEACVTAAGRKLVSKSGIQVCSVAGLRLPFRCYVFEGPEGPLHVYYCLWEDRAAGRGFDSAALTYGNRLAPVLAGIRLCGQRSLELAVWGCGDEQRAEDVVRRKLGDMLKR